MTAPFIHPLADVADAAEIGAGTRVWQFAIVLAGATVGRDCNVCAHTLIEGGVTIGRGAMIGAGAVVTKSVPDGETWVGNPARRLVAG